MHKGILCVLVAVVMLTSLVPSQVHATFTPCVQQSADSWYCYISLNIGWNLISLPIVPVVVPPLSPDTLFGADLSGYLQYIYVIWALVGGVWKYCNVGHTGSGDLEIWHCAGTLTTIQDGIGYYVFDYHSSFTTHNINGNVIPGGSAPPSYSLVKGWNLIGYRPVPDPNANSTVGQYLSSVNGSYDVHKVWVFDLGKGVWYRDNGFGTTVVAPTFGMWVYMTRAATLYP